MQSIGFGWSQWVEWSLASFWVGFVLDIYFWWKPLRIRKSKNDWFVLVSIFCHLHQMGPCRAHHQWILFLLWALAVPGLARTFVRALVRVGARERSQSSTFLLKNSMQPIFEIKIWIKAENVWNRGRRWLWVSLHEWKI